LNDTKKKNCRWFIEDFAAKEQYDTTRARNVVNHLKTYASCLQRDLELDEIVATIARRGSGRRAIIIEVYDNCRRNTIYQLQGSIGSFSKTPAFGSQKILKSRFGGQFKLQKPTAKTSRILDRGSKLPKLHRLSMFSRCGAKHYSE